jgi:GxxExxY protein
MEVHRVLGPGFVEAIYQRALLHELKLRGFAIETERQLDIEYKHTIVGVHRLDMVVEKSVVVELKAVNSRRLRQSRQLICGIGGIGGCFFFRMTVIL